MRVAALLAGALLQVGGLVQASPTASPGGGTPPAQTSSDSRAVGKSKLLQARAQLAQGNLDAAETLANEVARLGLTWSTLDDSPAQVHKAVARARKDPHILLKAGRGAFARRDYIQAESYARMADKEASVLTFAPWSDSPSKLLDEIQKVRKAPVQQANGTTPPASTPGRGADPKPGVVQTSFDTRTNTKVPPAVETRSSVPATSVASKSSTAPKPTRPSGNEADEARQLIKQARAAMNARHYDEAQKLAAQARAKKANLSWWEDNPERLDADLRTVTAKASQKPAASTTASGITPAQHVVPGSPAPVTGRSPAIPRTKEDARAQLALGRKQLSEGKLDEAARTAQRVKSSPTISWGLFEDSPDRLAIDIEKNRTTRDRNDADRLMAEGRKLYEKGDFEAATRAAYRAQKLHGPYSIWDLGDRPSKLLADIQTAQARTRKTALPPATVARNDSRPGSLASKVPVSRQDATNLVKGPPAPASGAPEIKQVASGSNLPQAGSTLPPVPGMMPPPSEAPSPDRLRAQQLVAEAQRCHREGKLLEARQKAVEAEKLGVRFGPEEVGPEFVYQQVAIEVRQKVDGLMRQAHEAASFGKGDQVERCRLAERHLEEARTLAASFGQDVRPVEDRLTQVRAQLTRSTMEQGTPAPASTAVAQNTLPLPGVAPAVTTVVGMPNQEGHRVLESARLELTKGETATARRLAEKALTGNYGVRDEAMALLRSIDAEEFNQKRLATSRAFDAAMASYRRREFSRAGAMIAAIDVKLLDADRQGRLREMSMSPEMSAVASASSTAGQARASDQGGKVQPSMTGIVTTGGTLPGSVTPGAGLARAGTATPTMQGVAPAGQSQATDGGDSGLLDRHRQMQRVVFEKLRQDGLEVQREAAEKFRTGQSEAALEQLQDYLTRVNEEKLEPGQLTLLRRPVESRLSHFRLLKAQKELATGAVASKQIGMDKVVASRRAEEQKNKNVEKLMKDFNSLFKEGKYLEAESLAMRALELDPDNGVATAAVYMARRQRDVTSYKKIKDGRERMVLGGLNDAEDEGPAGAIKDGVTYDGERWNTARKRKGLEPVKLGRPSEKEKAIERQLTTPISISFDNTPLRQVLDELRDVHGVNIVADTPALQEAGVSIDSPISIKLDRVSLKSAMNIILHQVRLTHVIKDEVLMITTEENARGKLQAVTYSVGDLVIPIEDFGPSRNTSSNGGVSFSNSTPTPVTGPQSLVTGTPVGNPTGSMLNGTSPNSMSGGGVQQGGTTTTKRGPSNTTEEQLIKLITSTINPRSWSEMGGPGTIEYFPMTMSMVINQSPDIQEQIQDLLAALRRLQDQEVSVEVRFISVSEDFFERIGVNFNMNIVNKQSRRFEPLLQQNAFVFDNGQFINRFIPGRFLSGMTAANTLTPTLDFPITNQSFFNTVPAFGGYTTSGLTMGLAFLSDIQVFLFLEAAQGDTRTNIMQAPKLTLFNGQTAQLQVGFSQNLVTGVQVAQLAGGQFAMIPQVFNNPLASTSLLIQAVISADRRFVRLSLQPQLTNLAPGPINAFPIVVPIFTSIEGNQAGQPVVFTQFIQQPEQSFVSVQTTVAVPDGGTVLMGGLKRMSEARSEYGPPILSKIPYVNRLFKNVGYGRETESLLIMVTPRIIIQAEEEERQTGYTTPTTGGTIN